MDEANFETAARTPPLTPARPSVRGGVIAKFSVTCEMPIRWVPQFLSMLAEMQTLGSVGSSRVVSIFADGDGDFRPKFTHHVKFDIVTAKIGEGDSRQFDAG